MRDPKKLKLQPQLVPKPLWGISGRRKIGRNSWQRIRQDALEAAGHRCEICGESPHPLYGDPLICHEVWRYDDRRAIAALVGFEIHCGRCDAATHMGRAMAHGYGDTALEQLCQVNGITRLEAERIFSRAMIVWRKRSAKEWRVRVDKAVLERYARLAVLETSKGRE